MAFKELKHVDKKNKYAVYGWIRNKERILKLQNVPAMVTAICILYYSEYDRFDQDLIHHRLNVTDKYRAVSVKPGLYGGSAFGINIATKGSKYHWKIKIEEDESGRNPCMNIGIFEAKLAKSWLGRGWWAQSNGYSYFSYGNIWSKNHSNESYGTYLKAGDIIDVWLDLKDDYSLSYGKNRKKYRNGENYGTAFDINKDINYRLALEVKKGKAVIQSFQVIH